MHRRPCGAPPGFGRPLCPLAGRSTGLAGGAKDSGNGLAFGCPQSLAPRAEVGRSTTDDDAPDGPTAAGARFARALVDLQPLLHRTVAIGRRVVVDRAAPALDRLGQDLTNRPRTGAFRRSGGATWRAARDAAGPPTGLRPHRCCRSRRGTTGRAGAA